MPRKAYQTKAAKLIKPVKALEKRMLDHEHRHRAEIARVGLAQRDSARNLIHYLALRQVDVRGLQMNLAELGMSSIGRMEAYALDGLQNVLRALLALSGAAESARHAHEARATDTLDDGGARLKRHANALLGSPTDGRDVRIMVTMPSAAATDAALVAGLLEAGMNVMRINCAHDDPTAWRAMIRNLRAAERQIGRHCKVYADLAGPKLRTGPLAAGARVCRIKPQRDQRGRVTAAGTARFTARASPQAATGAIPLQGKVIRLARAGDELRLIDARGKKRRLTVTAKSAGAVQASCEDTVYFEDGVAVELHRAGRRISKAKVSGLPLVEEPLLLKIGEQLVLTRLAEPGRPAQRDARGKPTRPAFVSCTLPEVFDAAKPGERIYFDDGKIGGRILSNRTGNIVVRITQAAAAGSRLGSEKGINLPDTQINTPALTTKDLADLKFMVRHADIIGMSFVRTVTDIEQLWTRMDELGAARVGTVLKIENKAAFENLPRLLLRALTHPPAGVMVARGDLAIELGFERLAEVQEQILWLCEAAHVPVIWATQVLDTMARSGTPSRAEVTDAVMSGRAECVMLNKGPYMADVVRLLTDILKRMSAHQSKKRSLLRPLSISRID